MARTTTLTGQVRCPVCLFPIDREPYWRQNDLTVCKKCGRTFKVSEALPFRTPQQQPAVGPPTIVSGASGAALSTAAIVLAFGVIATTLFGASVDGADVPLAVYWIWDCRYGVAGANSGDCRGWRRLPLHGGGHYSLYWRHAHNYWLLLLRHAQVRIIGHYDDDRSCHPICAQRRLDRKPKGRLEFLVFKLRFGRLRRGRWLRWRRRLWRMRRWIR